MNTFTTAAPSDSLSALVNRMAGLMRHGQGVLTAGDTAALRRMDPRKPAAAFYKLSALALEDQESTWAGEREARWAAIVVGLAHMGDLHHSGSRLGDALAMAAFSELRFARLLRADRDRLIDELPMLARFLVAKGMPADWTQAALLLQSVNRSDEESVRRILAKQYFRTLHATNSRTGAENPE